MYELLIRIETLYIGAGAAWLLGVGAGAVLVGLLLWLAGAFFSAVIIGLLGAVVGSFCGLLVSQWLNLNPLLVMTVGAASLCLAAVLFRNIIILVIAVIVFALVSGTAYSSIMLGKLPPLREKAVSPFAMQSFSHMDPELRLSYLEQIGQAETGFFEKLDALLKDALTTMSPYKWKLLLSAVAGALACVMLIWLLKRLVFALCYSLIGTFLVFVGIESLLMAFHVQLCSALEGQRHALTAAYCVMVVIGAVVQLTVTKPRKPRHRHVEAEA